MFYWDIGFCYLCLRGNIIDFCCGNYVEGIKGVFVIYWFESEEIILFLKDLINIIIGEFGVYRNFLEFVFWDIVGYYLVKLKIFVFVLRISFYRSMDVCVLEYGLNDLNSVIYDY